MGAFIHESALIEDGVIIGDDTHIWHLCHVRKNATIGAACILGRGVFIDADVIIGSYVKIQNYVSVYTGVTVEDGVFIGPHVCFTNDLYPRAVNPDMSLKANDDWVTTPTLLHAGASIGANSTLLCGITIGRWTMIGAGSVVIRDVPDYALVVGNPARQIGFVCSCGRRADNMDAVSACIQREHGSSE